jgi:hypothetical protein
MVKMLNVVFRVVTLCSLLAAYQCFWEHTTTIFGVEVEVMGFSETVAISSFRVEVGAMGFSETVILYKNVWWVRGFKGASDFVAVCAQDCMSSQNRRQEST